MCRGGGTEGNFTKPGNAWKEEGWGGQQAVVDHAKKLGYPGKIAPAGSSKAEWTSFTKAFNAWKASGMKGSTNKKPAPKKSAPKTAPAPKPKPEKPKAGSKPGLGPYPEENVFFPMLNQAYTAPNAMDLSAYMPADPYGGGMLMGGAPSRYDQAVFPGVYDAKGNLDMTKNIGRPDYSEMQGLLYQPFTTEYQQAFVAPSLWNYQPPQLRVGPVQFMGNPYAMTAEQLAGPPPGSGKKKKKKKGTADDDEAIVPEESHLPKGSQGGVPDGSKSGDFGEGGQAKGGGLGKGSTSSGVSGEHA